ncbi:MAG: HD domain-containing protein [Candidatus Omnitrophica bacterium]|nr:HD domain-containing protein [Candidatus Omnitrophota bacterium]
MNIFKTSFKVKLIVVFVFLSLIISSISLYMMYRKTVHSQMEHLKASLLMTATLGAKLIDGDAHKNINLEPRSIQTEPYKRIKKQLTLIRKANPLIRYVYTIGKSKDGQQLFFVVDSAHIEELFSYPGDRYDSINEIDVMRAFESPQVNKKLLKDRWGSYLSGYAPIGDSSGNTIAVLGLDMSGETIEAARHTVQQSSVAIFILCIILSIVLGYILAVHLMNPITVLVEGTKNIARGNFNYKVAVKTKDELGKLAESFNQMSDALKESNKELRRSFLNTISALTTALEAKDPYTKGHSERVMNYGIDIARELGVSEEEIENLKYFYIMHDIGKIGVNENILNKAGDLSAEERQAISEHSEIGGDILAPISFLGNQLIQIVRSHHERPDGRGYPEGLKAKDIPLSVAILAVADAYDAMTTERSYRKAFDKEMAKSELINNAGTQFNKEAVTAFIKVLERNKE